MNGVRPTKRCLDDLGLVFPPLTMPLHEISHELVAKGQRLPSDHASGGAERIRSIDDRVWFKVKVGEYRGAGGHVTDAPVDVPAIWWLVGGGLRRGDSKDQDFYERLEAECARAAKGSPDSVNSDHLLPKEIDARRFEVEQAALGVASLQQVVREAICRSAHSGKPVTATTDAQRLVAWVKSGDADTYLAISTEGFLDPREIAIVLDSIPGMSPDDWQPEPGTVLGIKPGVGQLVYSAMIPPEVLAEILEGAPGGYL